MTRTLGELSRLAGLHFGLADVKDAFHRFKISTQYSSFLADSRSGRSRGGSPFGWTCLPLLQQPANGSYLELIVLS